MPYETILPAFLAADLLIPFLLAPTYRGYRHRRDVMSALGNPQAPLHLVYQVWLVALGAALLAGAGPLCEKVAGASRAAAGLLYFVVAVYAVGGCILAGVFPVGESKEMETVSAKLHGYGAAIGFMALMFAPLLVSICCFRAADPGTGALSLVCFVLAAGCFALFVTADRHRGTVLGQEGLWQRLALLWMYLPLAMLCRR